MRVVHLPVYRDNAYQPSLMAAQERLGAEVIDGGGGGRFLRTALTKWKADVVHFHWLHPYLLGETRAGTLVRGLRFLTAVALLRLAGQRVVWTLHNLQNHDRRQVGLERWFTRRFVRRAGRLIAHCPAAAEAGRERFGGRADRWVVVPHPSYVGRYPDTLTRDAARARLGLSPTDLVFGFLGRIEAYKGVLELVRTFRAHAPANARLVIAGKPAAGSEAAIADACEGSSAILFRPGYVPDEDVQVYLRAADVMTFPFRDILTSSGVLLAQSFGKPVIAPALGCIPETVAAGQELLYPADDPEGLARALGEAVRRRDELAAIGAANRARAEAWTWDAAAEATLRAYREAING